MGSEWTRTTLGDCSMWYSGGTPSKANPTFWEGNIPWVSAKDMKSFYLHDTEDHLTEEGVQNGSRIAPAESILLLVRGMTLHNDLPICIIKQDMAFNQDVKAIIPNQNINSNFLAYWFLAHKPTLLKMVDSASHGTGRIHTDVLKSIEVSLPPLPEQRAIARVLGSLDDKIELNRKMNATLEETARAIFQSWFVDFDPVRTKAAGQAPVGLDAATAALFPAAFEEVDGRMVPQGWDVKNLDQIATYLNGLALQKFPPTDEEFLPVIKIAQMRKGSTEDSDKASPSIPEAYIIEDGDILFSWSGSLEVVLWCGGQGALNQHLFKVTSNIYPKWFYYLWTRYHLPGFQAIAADKATTMGHIQRHHLTQAKVIVPTPQMMDLADRTVAPLIDQITNLKLQSRTLAELRDTLLPRLLSGELRVRDVEPLL
ncbi:restriction endonuclease subunit S [Chloroflexia bacterium SDU3-3]|nr:restriction endonuclease subunit S [Chloroflexia bacterium SDU3-3]